MKRLFRRFVCLIKGHDFKPTEIYHIEYQDEGYIVAGWYVHYCRRCRARKGTP